MFVASCNWQWWSKNIFNPSYIPCLYVFIICYLKFIEVEKLLSSFPLLALELAATISKRKICCNKKIFKAICNNKDLYSVIIWKKKSCCFVHVYVKLKMLWPARDSMYVVFHCVYHVALLFGIVKKLH